MAMVMQPTDSLVCRLGMHHRCSSSSSNRSRTGAAAPHPQVVPTTLEYRLAGMCAAKSAVRGGVKCVGVQVVWDCLVLSEELCWAGSLHQTWPGIAAVLTFSTSSGSPAAGAPFARGFWV